MSEPTHYEILGVANTASAVVIKAVHRTLAKTLHPDREGGDEKQFALVNAAADVLLDPAKRALYDADVAAAIQEPQEQVSTAPEPDAVAWDAVDVADVAPTHVGPQSRLGRLPGWARVMAVGAPFITIGVTALIVWPAGIVTAIVAAIVLIMGWAYYTKPAVILLVITSGAVLLGTLAAPKLIPLVSAWIGLIVIIILNQEASRG